MKCDPALRSDGPRLTAEDHGRLDAGATALCLSSEREFHATIAQKWPSWPFEHTGGLSLAPKKTGIFDCFLKSILKEGVDEYFKRQNDCVRIE